MITKPASTAVTLFTLAAICLALAACAPTHVQTTQNYSGPALPRPDVVVVNDFAVTPDEVKLDRGLSARLGSAFSGTSTDAQQVEAGRKVAMAVSKALVQEIQKLGLPAVHANSAAPATGSTTVLVTGQLLSVDEGNRTRRNLIGLGAGHSDVQADTQVYYSNGGAGRELVERFAADAQSARKPGAAETMGFGAAADRAGEMAATSAGASLGSEALSADVDADGQRMAEEIAKKLAEFFAGQGWTATAR